MYRACWTLLSDISRICCTSDMDMPTRYWTSLNWHAHDVLNLSAFDGTRHFELVGMTYTRHVRTDGMWEHVERLKRHAQDHSASLHDMHMTCSTFMRWHTPASGTSCSWPRRTCLTSQNDSWRHFNSLKWHAQQIPTVEVVMSTGHAELVWKPKEISPSDSATLQRQVGRHC